MPSHTITVPSKKEWLLNHSKSSVCALLFDSNETLPSRIASGNWRFMAWCNFLPSGERERERLGTGRSIGGAKFIVLCAISTWGICSSSSSLRFGGKGSFRWACNPLFSEINHQIKYSFTRFTRHVSYDSHLLLRCTEERIWAGGGGRYNHFKGPFA